MKATHLHWPDPNTIASVANSFRPGELHPDFMHTSSKRLGKLCPRSDWKEFGNVPLISFLFK
jgi:hypothetical protein